MKKDANAILAAMMAAAMLDDEPEPTTTVDIRTKSKELGEMLYQSFLGFMDAGFNEEQAIRLTAAIARRN